MVERLFSEAEWRAIVHVERLTESNFVQICYEGKRIYGPSFAGGEYFLGYLLVSVHPSLIGPPMAAFQVFERLSGIVLTFPCPQRHLALAAARMRIGLMGPEYYGAMLAKAKEENSERLAAQEAWAAIAKAKAQKKPRKIGKRARAVFDASEGKCHYCGVALTLDGRWHIEHKMPRALFGGSEQDNLAAACAPCNHAKRDKTDLEFAAILAAPS